MERIVLAKLWKPWQDLSGEDCTYKAESGANPSKRFRLVFDDGPLRFANTDDNRKWTVLHREAADLKNSTIAASSFINHLQDVHFRKSLDVNAVGPGGLTPLMLAITNTKNSLDGKLDRKNTEDSLVGQVVEKLIKSGARLECRSDWWEETALHLAARYGRTEAAKRLLRAGADANARDKTGRTALHLAVTANAQGVFKILLQHRDTELNAQSDDGTTPLIYAARFLVNNMIEDLIKAGAEVNMTDEHGKTALHWSAYVGSHDGTLLLLRKNASKDAQDAKGQTPLFLASMEGNASVVKILLASFCNRNLPDDMNRSPLDIAEHEKHTNVVELLSNWSSDYDTPSRSFTSTFPGSEMSHLETVISQPELRQKAHGSPQKLNRKILRNRSQFAGVQFKKTGSLQALVPNENHSHKQKQVYCTKSWTISEPCTIYSTNTVPSPVSSTHYPSSDHMYGNSLWLPNSTTPPSLISFNGTPLLPQVLDPMREGIVDSKIHTMDVEASVYGNQLNQNLAGSNVINTESSVDPNELSLLLGTSHEEHAKDCMYQDLRVNMVMLNGVTSSDKEMDNGSWYGTNNSQYLYQKR